MTASFIPVFTHYRANRPASESWDFARRMFWTLAMVMSGVALLGVILAPALVRLFTLASQDPEQWSLAVRLTRITFPYCLLIALTALAAAILNTLRVFALPASVPIYLNMAIIAAAGLAWFLDYQEPALILAYGVLIGGTMQLLVQIPLLARRGMPFGIRVDFEHPGMRRVVRLLLPAFAGVGIYQVNVLVGTIFASRSEGWISALYYADRVMELVLGAYAISVATVVLPVLSEQVVEKKLVAMRETLTFSLRNVTFIVVPAAVGLIVLSGPIIRMLFQHKAFTAMSTDLTAQALVSYAVGLPGFAAVRLLVQGFYAMEDTRTPVRVAALAMLANVAFCVLLIGPLGHRGIALATSLAAYLNLAMLYVGWRRRAGNINEARLAISVGRTLCASIGMGLICWWLTSHLELVKVPEFSLLSVGCLTTIGIGIPAYWALAWLVRSEELNEVYTLVTGRSLTEKLRGTQTRDDEQ